MNNQSAVITNNKSVALDIIGWLFGLAVLAIGLINTFWGNDPGFGIFIVFLSFIYFPPVNSILRKVTSFSIPRILKILVGIFIFGQHSV
jgi:hypothetical protein